MLVIFGGIIFIFDDIHLPVIFITPISQTKIFEFFAISSDVLLVSHVCKDVFFSFSDFYPKQNASITLHLPNNERKLCNIPYRLLEFVIFSVRGFDAVAFSLYLKSKQIDGNYLSIASRQRYG